MLSRRDLVTSGCSSLLLQGAAPKLPPRPNIVLFLSDDHGVMDSPVYGARDVRTSAMQKLAGDGMVFTGVFTGSPTCVPSRSVLMSGLLPARNGALPNHSGLAAGVRTLPSFLKNLGYEVVHFGKSHFQPAANYPDWTHVDSETRAGPLNSDLQTAVVNEWLAARAAAAPAAPLCAVVCSHSPHVYWRENAGYDPARLTLPPTFVDTPETRSERAKYYSDITFADLQLGEVYASCRKHLSRNTLFIYTSDNGAQWPFAKWSLYDAGIHVPFLAAWPGVIRPRSRSSALISFADILPTFVELAGGHPPAGIDGRSFAGVLAGQAKTHRGEIYAAHSGDRDFNVYPMRCVRTHRFKYILNLHPEFEYTTHIDVAGPNDGRIYFDSWIAKARTDPEAAGIVRRYHEHPPEELYLVSSDPHERTNLARRPEFAGTLQQLRAKVREWMQVQGDEGRVFGNPRLLAAAGSPGPALRFRSAPEGGYTFNTGILSGKLRGDDKSVGLLPVVHVPSGQVLTSSMGFAGHYRVFSGSRRFGAGAWYWPSTSKLLEDGAVETHWPASEERPFDMWALYRWSAPAALDLETRVLAHADLPDFETFLAWYSSPGFISSSVLARGRDGTPLPLAAAPTEGAWQMFPRDEAAARLIQDGRWKVPPNPVEWTIRPPFALPIAVRTGARAGLSLVLLASPRDCFAISTPHESDSHYSLYLSLFGRAIRQRETAIARVRMVVTSPASLQDLQRLYADFLASSAPAAN